MKGKIKNIGITEEDLENLEFDAILGTKKEVEQGKATHKTMEEIINDPKVPENAKVICYKDLIFLKRVHSRKLSNESAK